jgi:two-component system phosphate regulon sensor histidine kinase PhoR
LNNTFKRIVLILVLILVLPITAFFIYQFATLNESESEINKIYIQQLEAIIYSVNQYSEDVVSSWVNDIDRFLMSGQLDDKDKFNLFLKDNISIKNIFVADAENYNSSLTFYSFINSVNISKDSLISFLDQNKQVIQRLKNFLDVGYQKIETIGKFNDTGLYLCLFPLNYGSFQNQIGGIFFNPNDFIDLNLASKISQACGNEFVLAIVDKNNNIVYSCDKITSSEILVNKELWLLPGLSLGIKMKNGGIEEFVKQRYFTNLTILGSLLLILLIGVLLIYYNLRKELRLTQLKADFVSNVSHELRTPLSLISMYSETLVLDRIKDENKKREYYSVINNETNRLSKIVNSILNFSKMEAGTRRYNFESHNLIDVNAEILATYDYHIKSKGFYYETKIEDNIKDIKIDKDAVSESIINLIENALKYSSEQKHFEIIIGQNEIGPYWEIKDFGIGIGNEDQEKIFDKFYRVSTGLVHKTKGTGLGLSLVKQIMEAHSGNITVKSELGNGSTFRLQFNSNSV